MKMKFPEGVTHHHNDAGQCLEVPEDRMLDVPDHKVGDYLAAGFTNVEAEAVEAPKSESEEVAVEGADGNDAQANETAADETKVEEVEPVKTSKPKK